MYGRNQSKVEELVQNVAMLKFTRDVLKMIIGCLTLACEKIKEMENRVALMRILY